MMITEVQKLALNGATVVAWVLGIAISFVAVKKRHKMKEEMGISIKTYMVCVFVTEIIYAIGALMILSAMGVNVMQHLAAMEWEKVYSLLSKIDMSTIRIVGIIGWIGFVMNRSISFLSPGYLLVCGGRKLPKYFFYSAWTEVGLEIVTTGLIFATLRIG